MVKHLDKVFHYFNALEDSQIEQIKALWDIYIEWNEKINVISRKDIEELYLRHVLHSLTIAKFIKFRPGASVLDLGTGGGFPGIPLAIYFPETNFHLVDGTAKKIRVVNEVVKHLDLKNVLATQDRAEELKTKYDFIVTRAVANMSKLREWSLKRLKQEQIHAMPNGIIALKGGNISQELKELPKGDFVEKISIIKYFPESHFEEKYLVYLQM